MAGDNCVTQCHLGASWVQGTEHVFSELIAEKYDRVIKTSEPKDSLHLDRIL